MCIAVSLALKKLDAKNYSTLIGEIGVNMDLIRIVRGVVALVTPSRASGWQ